jgi:glycosyltransferase involved in cell wall biosynthesis
MRLLMITSGYLPYMFSENLCNAKLVYALREAGIEVDVISKVDEGPTYGDEWVEPWTVLKPSTYQVTYPLGNSFTRFMDVAYSCLKMGVKPGPGVRWQRRAYEIALKLMEQHHYDAILTRSPNDYPHAVGRKLKRKTGIKWIANWNDPADPIWPAPYTHLLSKRELRKEMAKTEKLLSHANVTTFPSESLRTHFMKSFPSLETQYTAVIPHIGLSSSLFKKIVRQRNEKFMMCHSGNLSKERNPELTFQALRAIIDGGFSNFEFDIMGHVNDFTQALIQKYGLENHVKCIGSFQYMDALERMQYYDVLVLLEAKLEEGIFFASKFTDYAQTGLPILAISPLRGFAHYMINAYDGGLFANNEDMCSIKAQIESLIDLWKKNELGTLSSERLFKNFSPDKVVETYKSIIKDEAVTIQPNYLYK